MSADEVQTALTVSSFSTARILRGVSDEEERDSRSCSETVWYTGTSLVGLKSYRHFFLADCHTGIKTIKINCVQTRFLDAKNIPEMRLQPLLGGGSLQRSTRLSSYATTAERMKIDQYRQKQRCKHVEVKQFYHAFASRGFVSDSWAFLF